MPFLSLTDSVRALKLAPDHRQIQSIMLGFANLLFRVRGEAQSAKALGSKGHPALHLTC